MTARYYIYRNLHHQDAFSIRHLGKVISRPVRLLALRVKFHVSEAGRQLVRSYFRTFPDQLERLVINASALQKNIK